MANFINESRLRRYQEPLTLDILARLHESKNKKERKAQVIADAQAEAKLRAQRNRERWRYINCITTSSVEGDYNPPILINLSVYGQTLKVLIDSGADTNVISYEAYEKLKCYYTPTSTQLTSYANKDTKAVGITTLCLIQSEFKVESQFYITRPNQSNHQRSSMDEEVQMFH